MMNLELQKKIFEKVLDYESSGEVFEEIEVVSPNCFVSIVTKETKRKYITTLDLKTILEEFSLDEINEGTKNLIEKSFLKGNRVSRTAGESFYEITEALCDMEDFLEDF